MVFEVGDSNIKTLFKYMMNNFQTFKHKSWISNIH